MSIIKDPSLAPAGMTKIQWVRSHIPALSEIEKQFEKEQPFKGLRIAVSVHLEAKTSNLGLVLKKGGAEVYLTGCNPCPPRMMWLLPYPRWVSKPMASTG